MVQLTLLERVRAVRGGARVERAHGIPHQGSYSNAMHQWGVAHLIHVFWPEKHDVLVAALFHDTPEAWVGDIPSPLLRNVPEAAGPVRRIEKLITNELEIPNEHDLSSEDFACLKAADRLEFFLWCQDQIRMGNMEVTESFIEVNNYLRANRMPSPAQEFYEQVCGAPNIGHRAAGVIQRLAKEK